MKRFITYLYAYKDGHKMKNTGHVRVDVRGHMLDLQINIKEAELDNDKGVFYIIGKKEIVSKVLAFEIQMQEGCYNGRHTFNSRELETGVLDLENIIGVGIQYENAYYMASCWKDGEEEVIANVKFECPDMEENIKENIKVVLEDEIVDEMLEEGVIVAAVAEIEEFDAKPDVACDVFNRKEEIVYRTMNLNEIYNLPSCHWHFSNNSFLLHGFWNYGYLVLKENMAEDVKGIALGIPGVFEQPEMVMATYFGFPKFEVLPSQEMEMQIGECFTGKQEEKKQQPQVGAFGCWFTDL